MWSVFLNGIRKPKNAELQLIKDMVEYLKLSQDDDFAEEHGIRPGVGLAAPQIGENIRVFVVDCSSGDEPLNPITFINPKIIKKSGACKSNEGCLSFPEAYTDVKRYANVKVKAIGLNGKPFIIEGKDGSLLARAIQHEFDHLDGILFVDHCRSEFEANRILTEKGLNPIEQDKVLSEPELEDALSSLPTNPGDTILPEQN